MTATEALLRHARGGHRLSAEQARSFAQCHELAAMMEAAADIRDQGHGAVISYSRKVFIPLTKLCRNSCHYCTFVKPPKRGERCYLTAEEVLEIAHAGALAGCREALFTLGDKPEFAGQRRAMSWQNWATPPPFLISPRWRNRFLREPGCCLI